MKPIKKLFQLAAIALLVSACAHAPMGPTVASMPPDGKPFSEFANENAYCKSYAEREVDGQVDQANLSGAGEALVGTALGAGIGAAFGGGHGALIGGSIGGAAGTLSGSGSSSREQNTIQNRYNIAFAQCMAAYGNDVGYPSGQQIQRRTVIYRQPVVPVFVPVRERYRRYHYYR